MEHQAPPEAFLCTFSGMKTLKFHIQTPLTICEHFISIGDRERLYHGSQRWIQQQMARLPARMKSVDRNEQIARITRLAALNHTPSTVRPDLPPPSSQSRLREYLL